MSVLWFAKITANYLIHSTKLHPSIYISRIGAVLLRIANIQTFSKILLAISISYRLKQFLNVKNYNTFIDFKEANYDIIWPIIYVITTAKYLLKP
jgi:hypothetical protein